MTILNDGLGSIMPSPNGIILSVDNENPSINTKDRLFLFYRMPVSNVVPHKDISLLEVYHAIVDQYFMARTFQLRTITDKAEARKYKASYFNYVTFSGVFSKRNNQALIKHSGYMVIDLDHLENVQEVKELLLADSEIETQLLFVSPSGNGLKWVIDVDLETATHSEYFLAVKNYLFQRYGLEVDASGKDVARACFLPYDKDVYINPKYLSNDF